MQDAWNSAGTGQNFIPWMFKGEQNHTQHFRFEERWKHNNIPPNAPTPEGWVDLPGEPAINAPPAAPPWMPAIDPLSVPINAPPFVPQPLPWRMIPGVRPNPFRSPREQTQKGNSPQQLPGPNTDPAPDPFSRPVTRSVTSPVSRVRVEISVDPRLALNPQRARPGERKKEVKLILARAAGSLVSRLMNAATESNDFLTAIHKALPEECKAKRTNPIGKARDIYACFSQINWDEALCNVAKNELEDRIYGKAGRGWARVNRKNNHPSGSPRRAGAPRLPEEAGEPEDILNAACDAILGGH